MDTPGSVRDRSLSVGSPPQLHERAGWRFGKMRPAILLWALGVPIPFVLLFLLIRGCT